MICYVFSTVSAPDDVIISILLCHVHDWRCSDVEGTEDTVWMRVRLIANQN